MYHVNTDLSGYVKSLRIYCGKRKSTAKISSPKCNMTFFDIFLISFRNTSEWIPHDFGWLKKHVSHIFGQNIMLYGRQMNFSKCILLSSVALCLDCFQTACVYLFLASCYSPRRKPGWRFTAGSKYCFSGNRRPRASTKMWAAHPRKLVHFFSSVSG